jgi:hypothetical protein
MAIEVLRAWVANNGLVCSLRPTTWQSKPSAWGIVLADLARHVANALEELSDESKLAILQAIRDAFNKELNNPTDQPAGSFVQ